MAYYENYLPDENGVLHKVVINAGVGFVLPYYGETAPPGTLACDGSEISRAAYDELFAVLGTKAGAGNGSTTFNLPDLRNRWIVGAGDNVAMTDIAEGLPNISGGLSGTNILTGSLTWQQHQGESEWDQKENAITTTFSTTSGRSATSDKVDQIFGFKFDASGSNPIYGAQPHVTPASTALLWCIIYE